MHIITHPDKFHADEVVAIATLAYFNNISISDLKIQRDVPTKEELKNPDIWVLDIGREYNPSLNNFDHHQDRNIESTNVLILEHVCKDKKLVKVMKENLYQFVSDMDRGFILADHFDHMTFSSVINDFNYVNEDSDVGFYKALSFVSNFLIGFVQRCKNEIEGEKIWNKLERGNNYVLNLEHKIPNWKKLAKRDEIMFMIVPNKRELGGYTITSRSTDEYVIPKMEKQLFRHSSGFMAIYPTIEDCIYFCKNVKT